MNGEPGTALGEDLARRIGAEVDAGFDAQLAFLQELVRRPSVRGQEHLAQYLMFQAMRERGYEMDRWRVDPKDIEHHPGFSPVAGDYAHARTEEHTSELQSLMRLSYAVSCLKKKNQQCSLQ